MAGKTAEEQDLATVGYCWLLLEAVDQPVIVQKANRSRDKTPDLPWSGSRTLEVHPESRRHLVKIGWSLMETAGADNKLVSLDCQRSSGERSLNPVVNRDSRIGMLETVTLVWTFL